MNMTNPAPSVLTHGGDSDSALSSTIQTHSEVLAAQHQTVMQSDRVDRAPERHMHFSSNLPIYVVRSTYGEYPKVLHSTKHADHTKVVHSKEEEDQVFKDSGQGEDAQWSATPLEKVLDDNGNIKFQTAKKPTPVEAQNDASE